MNWKLAIDTFGETYHISTLHRNTLNNDFYGDIQMYDTYERNQRMALCLRPLDELRDKPKEEWDVLRASFPAYYLPQRSAVGRSGWTQARARLSRWS